MGGDRKTAFVLVDLQRDFLEEKGRLPVDPGQAERVIRVANAMLAHARATDMPTVVVANEFPRGRISNLFRGFAAVEGTRGAELDPRVEQVGLPYFPKQRANGFSNPALHEWLQEQGIQHLIFAGVYANDCVRVTVKGAVGHGYRVTVLSDGVAARTEGSRRRGLGACEKLGAHTTTSRAFTSG